MKKPFVKILILLVAIIINGCANVTRPSGGKKDVTPPVVIKEIPSKGSLNFNKNKIRVYFDEFVNVKNLNSQFISSPPLNKAPKALLKGKSVVFTFEDTLLENTTYNLNFGNSIVDNNESNALVNYYFAFSTGDYIDSLQVSGDLINASDLTPVEDVLVLLYDIDNFYDSIPYFELPSYIGKTNKSGHFNISYMRGGKYKIFALKDLNKNRIFDQPNENIAFLDSLIIPEAVYELHTDTIKLDSLSSDSIIVDSSIVYSPTDIKLLLFEEENHKQYLTHSNREVKEKCEFIFNEKLDNNYNISFLDTFNYDKLYKELSITGDTLNVWITDSSIYNIDTLNFKFDYIATDTLGELSMYDDTLKLIYKSPIKSNKLLKQKNKSVKNIEEKKPQINIEFNPKPGGKLGLNKEFFLTTEVPVNKINKEKIHLFVKEKNIFNPIEFNVIQDSIIKRKYYLMFNKKEEQDYKLLIDTNAFSNEFGLFNDTIEYAFSTQPEAFYGRILLNLTNVNQNVIIQLLSSNGDVLKDYYVNENKILTIDYLPANTYKLKIIYDNNGNKKWDTGKYLNSIQPEKIKFYKENITVRANWDIELNWDIEEN